MAAATGFLRRNTSKAATAKRFVTVKGRACSILRESQDGTREKSAVVLEPQNA